MTTTHARAPMLIDVEVPEPAIMVLTATGELNSRTAKRLADQIREQLPSAPFAIILHLDDVIAAVDGGGIEVLHDVLLRCRRFGVVVRLVSSSVAASRCVHLAGLDRVFVVRSAVSDAVAECRGLQQRTSPTSPAVNRTGTTRQSAAPAGTTQRAPRCTTTERITP